MRSRFFIKLNKCGIVINELLIITAIGERGVMKKKIVSLALVLGLFTLLGACDQTGGDAGTTDTSPSPAESPATSPSP